jgi:hypothetical protein
MASPNCRRRPDESRNTARPRLIAFASTPAAATGSRVHAFEGTYGDYLVGKVGKAFRSCGKRSDSANALATIAVRDRPACDARYPKPVSPATPLGGKGMDRFPSLAATWLIGEARRTQSPGEAT